MEPASHQSAPTLSIAGRDGYFDGLLATAIGYRNVSSVYTMLGSEIYDAIISKR
jgi:hypothetical protein